ncbi:uncharacterized protein LOC119090165 [Pollicipes pollicipes]|uniref:uncharacterized protein LOC119090165 n=1 Tax=Pollicipes pollicipes TaxID=41117 RepID=UPI001884A5DF|nr:uncharacterized protein LOC119090165 [Pollicipes pollicipes]
MRSLRLWRQLPAQLAALLLLAAAARPSRAVAGLPGGPELPQSVREALQQVERRLEHAQTQTAQQQAASTRQALDELQDRLERKLDEITRLVSQLSGGAAGAPTESVQQCALSCSEGRDCLVVDYRSADHCRPLQRLERCDNVTSAAASAGYYVSVTQTCARSCLQLLRQEAGTRDGVYRLNGFDEPVYCDMSRDGGGWTLLLTSTAQDGWSLETLLERAASRPAIDRDYSILRYADRFKALGKSDRFLYRLEAQAEKGRGRWGGVWSAPASYSFTHKLTNQTDVQLLKKFGKWEYGMESIQQRLPWINAGGYSSGKPLLTTTDQWRTGTFWGTLVTRPEQRAYRHSPWVFGTVAQHSGTVLYWLREENV